VFRYIREALDVLAARARTLEQAIDVARVVEGVEDVVVRGGAHVVPGGAGDAQINRPAGSARTCTLTPWHLRFLE
jgi:hypothetical protein